MVKGYDNLKVDYGTVIDLPFDEGVGVITRDIAKPHHQDIALVGPPTWDKIALSNANVLSFVGDYLECPAAATADLDFTAEDYSIACWLNIIDTATSEIIVGRYALDTDGWELFLFDGNLQLRHHHVSLFPDVRDGCYSTGWAYDTWCFMGVSRSGLYPVHYRNGQALPMSYEASGMQDPDSANRDLVIGVRYTKNADYYRGSMKRLRIFDRSLSADEWRELFEMERHLYGV